MDLGLDEQQEMLKNFAQDFLEKECPEQLIREMEPRFNHRNYLQTRHATNVTKTAGQGHLTEKDDGWRPAGRLRQTSLRTKVPTTMQPGMLFPHTADSSEISLRSSVIRSSDSITETNQAFLTNSETYSTLVRK